MGTSTLFSSCDVYCGEEFYYLWRKREGGSQQSGPLNGFQIGLDRLKRYGWYIGGDYLYAHGPIEGKTSRGTPLYSWLTDQVVEGRFGYTLQKALPHNPFFTPFVGYGYFQEVNAFAPPSRLPCTFTDTFDFFALGFLSGLDITPQLSLEINGKMRFMQHARSEITDDPLFDTVSLIIEDEILYRIEAVVTYAPCIRRVRMGAQIAPFYEFRHFGGHEGYPFDFVDTKFYLVGMRIGLVGRF